jgi:hypothetical protein
MAARPIPLFRISPGDPVTCLEIFENGLRVVVGTAAGGVNIIQCDGRTIQSTQCLIHTSDECVHGAFLDTSDGMSVPFSSAASSCVYRCDGYAVRMHRRCACKDMGPAKGDWF